MLAPVATVAAGVLTVTDSVAEPITINSSASDVKVNGNDPTGGPFLANSITEIDVTTANSTGSTVDMTAVNGASGFTSLATVTVNAHLSDTVAVGGLQLSGLFTLSAPAATMTLDGSNGSGLTAGSLSATAAFLALKGSFTTTGAAGQDFIVSNLITDTSSITLTTSSSSGNAGPVTLGSPVTSPAGVFTNDLTINASATGGVDNGGSVTLAGVTNAAGGLVRTLSVNTSSTAGTAGAIFLEGGTQQTAGAQMYTGPVALGISVSVITSSSTTSAGSVTFANPISALAPGYTLTIDSSATGAGDNGGAVSIAGLSNAAGNYVSTLSVTSTSGAATDGSIQLSGTEQTRGLQDYTGPVVLNSSVSVITSSSTATGGAVRFDAISAAATGYDLTIDSSATGVGHNGGNIIIAGLSNAAGAYVNKLSVTTTSGSANAGGINLDGTEQTTGSQSYTGPVVLNSTVNIITKSTSGAAGDVTFGDAISAAGGSDDLTVDASATGAGNNGGAVTLDGLSNAAGSYVRNLTVTTTSASATSGAIRILADGHTTGTQTYTGPVTFPSNRTLTVTTVTFNSTATLSTSTVTITGALDFGAAAVMSSTLAGPLPAQYGHFSVSGAETITAGATLSANLGPGYVPSVAPPDAFTMIAQTGAGAISGTFANVADNSIVTFAGIRFLATYEGGAGHDLVLTTQRPTTVYVDDSWAGTTVGADPANDPISGGLVYGYSAFSDIQSAINELVTDGTGVLVIFGGTYNAAVDFNKTLAAIDINTNSDIPAETTVRIGGAVTLDADTDFSLAAITPPASPTQAAANLTFAAGATIVSTAHHKLTVDGTGQTVTFGDQVGVAPATALNSLTVAVGVTTDLNATPGADGSVITVGAQTYNGPVVLSASTILNSTTSGDITFASTIDDVTGQTGQYSLSVNTQGNELFEGRIGGTQDLASLTTDDPTQTATTGGAGGQTRFMGTAGTGAAPNVITAGGQTYNDAVVLYVSTILDSTNPGNSITFAKTVDANAAGQQALTVNAAGNEVFNDRVGGTADLTSLTTDDPNNSQPIATLGGQTQFNGTAGTGAAPNVITAAGQDYYDAVVLYVSTILDSTNPGNNITFHSTVDAKTAGQQALTANAAGNEVFDNRVGGNAALASLATDDPNNSQPIAALGGNTVFNFAATNAAASVITTGAQDYHDAVTLGANTVLDATASGNISFYASINATSAGAQSLGANTAGNEVFMEPVGAATSLSSLVTDDPGSSGVVSGLPAGQVQFAYASSGTASVTTSVSQDYNDAALLAANTTLASSTTTNVVTFHLTVDAQSSGSASLTTVANRTTFQGAVGMNAALSSLGVQTGAGSGQALINGGLVSTIGGQTYQGAVTLGGSPTPATTTLMTGSMAAFSSTVDGLASGTQALVIAPAGNGLGGNATFAGTAAGAVGSHQALLSLTVDGSTTVGSPGTTFTTTQDQNYLGPVLLNAFVTGAASTMTTGSTVTFGSTVDGGEMLSIAKLSGSGGNVVFDGAVGSKFPLNTLSVAGTTRTNTPAGVLPGYMLPIITYVGETYSGPVTLGADTSMTVSGGPLTFSSTIDAQTAGYEALTTSSTGTLTFGGPVGGAGPLSSLSSTTNAALLIAQNITTAGALDLTEARLGAQTTSIDTLEVMSGMNLRSQNGSVNLTAGEKLSLDVTSNVMAGIAGLVSLTTNYNEPAPGSFSGNAQGGLIEINGALAGAGVLVSGGTNVPGGALETTGSANKVELLVTMPYIGNNPGPSGNQRDATVVDQTSQTISYYAANSPPITYQNMQVVYLNGDQLNGFAGAPTIGNGTGARALNIYGTSGNSQMIVDQNMQAVTTSTSDQTLATGPYLSSFLATSITGSQDAGLAIPTSNATHFVINASFDTLELLGQTGSNDLENHTNAQSLIAAQGGGNNVLIGGHSHLNVILGGGGSGTIDGGDSSSSDAPTQTFYNYIFADYGLNYSGPNGKYNLVEKPLAGGVTINISGGNNLVEALGPGPVITGGTSTDTILQVSAKLTFTEFLQASFPSATSANVQQFVTATNAVVDLPLFINLYAGFGAGAYTGSIEVAPATLVHQNSDTSGVQTLTVAGSATSPTASNIVNYTPVSGGFSVSVAGGPSAVYATSLVTTLDIDMSLNLGSVYVQNLPAAGAIVMSEAGSQFKAGGLTGNVAHVSNLWVTNPAAGATAMFVAQGTPNSPGGNFTDVSLGPTIDGLYSTYRGVAVEDFISGFTSVKALSYDAADAVFMDDSTQGGDTFTSHTSDGSNGGLPSATMSGAGFASGSSPIAEVGFKILLATAVGTSADQATFNDEVGDSTLLGGTFVANPKLAGLFTPAMDMVYDELGFDLTADNNSPNTNKQRTTGMSPAPVFHGSWTAI